MSEARLRGPRLVRGTRQSPVSVDVPCIIAATGVVTQSVCARSALQLNSRKVIAGGRAPPVPNGQADWTRPVAHGTLDAHPAVSTLLNTLALKGGRRCECEILRRSAALARVRSRRSCRHREDSPPVPLCILLDCHAWLLEEKRLRVRPGNDDFRQAMALSVQCLSWRGCLPTRNPFTFPPRVQTSRPA